MIAITAQHVLLAITACCSSRAPAVRDNVKHQHDERNDVVTRTGLDRGHKLFDGDVPAVPRSRFGVRSDVYQKYQVLHKVCAAF